MIDIFVTPVHVVTCATELGVFLLAELLRKIIKCISLLSLLRGEPMEKTICALEGE